MGELIEEIRGECNDILLSLIEKHIYIAKMCSELTRAIGYYRNALYLKEVYEEKKLKIVKFIYQLFLIFLVFLIT